MRELRHAPLQMRLAELAVGCDGRNRCLLSVFGSNTCRNQLLNTRFIFGPFDRSAGSDQTVAWTSSRLHRLRAAGVWHRSSAFRRSDHALVLQQWRSLPGVWSAGPSISRIGTKACKLNKAIRDLFKACVLGVQYGMGEVSLVPQN